MNPNMRESLLSAMEFYFGRDRKRINHARSVLEFAEEILAKKKDPSVDRLVVTAAAVLHDIGIHACEKKYGSTDGHLQEKEGPTIARHIMEKLELKEKVIKEVCDIIAKHHSPGELDTLNFKVVYDADWLVNLKDEIDVKDKQRVKETIAKAFLTTSGKKIAEKIYL